LPAFVRPQRGDHGQTKTRKQRESVQIGFDGCANLVSVVAHSDEEETQTTEENNN
jgi:hypothetical protein